MSKFSHIYQVHYSDVDIFGYLSPVALFRTLEETANLHTASCDIGILKLLARGECWVLHNWGLSMNRYPRLDERFTVSTWCSGYHHFMAVREFTIQDEGGSVLGQATSRWIYLNINKMRPMRLPEDVAKAHTPCPEKYLECDFSDLAPLTETSFTDVIKPGIFALDTNRHVNNTMYIEWMLNQVGLEFYLEHTLSQAVIEYNNPTFYGQNLVISRSHPEIQGETIVIKHQVDNGMERKPQCLARSYWLPRREEKGLL